MKMSCLFTSLCCLAATLLQAQGNLPFEEIPDYPDTYTPEKVAARMIDGLGFRYYWATEGLRPEDLAFRPSTEARSTGETLDHILDLTQVILNTVKGEPTVQAGEEPVYPFEEKRKITLQNLENASKLLKEGNIQLEGLPVVFQGEEGTAEFPFWNFLNGPLADAIWHTGQVASFRRTSGNPLNPRVNVFTGKLRE